MTFEEMQRAMDFIVETIGRLVVNDERHDARLEKLIQAHEKASSRLTRDERILGLMIRAGRRERDIRRKSDARYEKRYRELLQAQLHTDSRLDALIDIMRQQRNGQS